MNFQDLQTVEDYQFYLDVAFKRAKDKSSEKKVSGKTLTERTKQLEKYRVEVIHGSITPRLMKILTSFPSLDGLPEFYAKLVKLTLDYPKVKQALGAVNWAVKQIDGMKRKYQQLIQKADHAKRAQLLRKQYYGRVSSVLKQIGKNLLHLEAARRIMKGYPTIKTSVFTVAIAGFPNVGKSTLLSKLSGSTPDIQGYAFTTKGINIGYTDKKSIQYLDTPGTLNRFNKMNNIEKIAHLAIQIVADVIVYVFDLTEPFPLKNQIKLLQNLKKEKKPIILFLSKTDILSKDQVAEFSKEFPVLTDKKELMQQIKKFSKEDLAKREQAAKKDSVEQS